VCRSAIDRAIDAFALTGKNYTRSSRDCVLRATVMSTPAVRLAAVQRAVTRATRASNRWV
jgi:hypothetical protein